MKKKLFVICVIVALILLSTSFVIKAEPNKGSVTREELDKAFQETIYAYHSRGNNIQYNTIRSIPYFSPEQATSQETRYIVCSGITRNVYNDLFGIKIPTWSAGLMSYARRHINDEEKRPEVIAYGKRSDDKLTMKFNKGTSIVEMDNPKLEDILVYLEIGDILTYSGHTLLIYDFEYDNNGEKIDAYVQGRLGVGAYINTKIDENGHHYLFHRENKCESTKLSEESHWKNLSNKNEYKVSSSEYSVLRFVNEVNGKLELNYLEESKVTTSGEEIDDEATDSEEPSEEDTNEAESNEQNEEYEVKVRHDHEPITLSEKVMSRIKFKQLYIEKTVDKFDNSVVETGDELVYTITVKNNSETKYVENVYVTENISEFVTYVNSSSATSRIETDESGKTTKVIWNLGKLNANKEVQIKYKVRVNEKTIGKIIDSTGTVGNIPSSTVTNYIDTNMNPEKEGEFENAYEQLKDKYSGRQLVDEIYKKVLGINLNIENLKLDLSEPSIFKLTGAKQVILNTKLSYSKMVVGPQGLADKQYYGMLKKNGELYDWYKRLTILRADTIYGEHLKIGDILIYKNSDDVIRKKVKDKIEVIGKATKENGEYAYIYLGNRGFVGINKGADAISGTDDDRNNFDANYYKNNELELWKEYPFSPSITDDFRNKHSLDDEQANLQTLLGKDCYVILRPSLAMDMVPMELDVQYSKKTLTNKDVTVTITANERMWNVEGWTLSEDKKTLTKTYSKNTEEIVKVSDYGGNEKTATIKINNIDKEKPILNVSYSTTKTTNQNVVVTITSNEELQAIDGWTLSQDKKKITKTYNQNKTENVEIKDLAGNTSIANIKVTNIDKQIPVVQVMYSTTEITSNDVIVTIIASEEIKEVEGWQLSDNKKELIKVYTKNGEETITIYDIAGNSVTETIKVDNIDRNAPEYEVQYSTTLPTNKDVTVKIITSEEIQSVDGWILSEDKKTLIKTYTENKEEEIIIKDNAGNITRETIIKINNIDKILPEVTISYSKKELTNQDVIVTITASEEIQEVEGWTISDDRKVLTKTVTSNLQENIVISDIAGNTVSNKIEISNIDKVAPKTEISYSTALKTNKDVVVTISSDKIIREVAGWTLLEDKKTLTKIFKENGEEEVIIIDEAGNASIVNIKVTNIDKSVTAQTTEYSVNSDKDATIAQKVLPNAGEKALIVFIVGLIVIVIISYIKIKKYENLK